MSDEWPFEAPRNTAVITTVRVTDHDYPVLLVTHDSDDGGWQFLCGGAAGANEARIIGLEEAVNRDPTLRELADLPEGWCARRDNLKSPWRREPNEPG